MSQRTLFLGDNINTDDIIPAKRGTNDDLNHLAHYALEHVIGAGQLRQYEQIEAGHNFGCGSSREFAPLAIKAAGIQKVSAKSFAEIFYRNSINIGLPLEIISDTNEPPPTHPLVDAIVQAGGLTAYSKARRAGKAAPLSTSTPSRSQPPHPMTIAEKLIAQASGNRYVQPGDVVFVHIDLAMSHDAIAGPVGALFHRHFDTEAGSAKVWDPDKVVFVADHFVQINDIRPDPGARSMHQQMVEFARHQGCHLLDVVSPGEAAGICHVLLPEKGFIRPGMMIAGTDSHSCTYGAFGCFSTGVGTTDMANILATGELWIRVPQTVRIELSGHLQAAVSAKDIMLFILGQLGCDGATGKVIEFFGSALETLPMDERMTLANMVIECGAMCGLMPVDSVTEAYVEAQAAERPIAESQGGDFAAVTPDPEANYAQHYHFDLSTLQPQVAKPPRPDQVVPISALGEVPITRAFIGSCTGGKLTDLAAAAIALKGQKVHPSVSLFVVPASQQVRSQAQALGYLDWLEQAGATVLKSGCGACINAGQGVLGSNETGIYATNRNFKGRSGDPSASNYLASPRTVALSAIRGRISSH
ncbi:MAG: aconitase/3-isopropylmalate dehydratase large subunit family protein [Cyanobacteria bacterium J06649_5]